MRVVVLGCLLLVAAGCASGRVNLTIYSDPDGGILYFDGAQLGQTPHTLYLTPTEDAKKLGYMTLRETSVRWVSGATATHTGIRVNIAQGSEQSFTIRRPESAPNAHIDYGYAAQLRQADAARAAALLPLLMNQPAYQAPQQQPYVMQPPAPNPVITCRSSAMGGVVTTSCQ